jgi:CHAT domain-containing protein
MSDIDSLKNKLEQISELRANIALAEGRVKLAKERYENLRMEALQELKAHDLTKQATSKISVTIKPKQEVKIINPVAAMEWLKKNNFPLEDYTTIDTTRAKPVFKNAVFEDGEVIEGIERIEGETLVVTDVKPKKEAA